MNTDSTGMGNDDDIPTTVARRSSAKKQFDFTTGKPFWALPDVVVKGKKATPNLSNDAVSTGPLFQYYDNSSPQNDGVGLTLDQMKEIFPGRKDKHGHIIDNTETLKAATFYINKYGKEFGLDDKVVLKHFLAQAGVETGGFRTLNATEDLSYKLKNITSTFSKYFKAGSGRNPTDYVHNAEKLANVVYSNRMGNGSEASGDGWRYKGGGLMQLTGKGEEGVKHKGYLKFTQFYQSRFKTSTDFVKNPELVSNTPEISVISGLWYFKENVNYANLENTPESVKSVSYKVNGGYNALIERQNMFIKIQKVLGN